MFPLSARFTSFNCDTNPYESKLDGIDDQRQECARSDWCAGRCAHDWSERTDCRFVAAIRAQMRSVGKIKFSRACRDLLYPHPDCNAAMSVLATHCTNSTWCAGVVSAALLTAACWMQMHLLATPTRHRTRLCSKAHRTSSSLATK
jgi:hypothetical protein